jgi:integrase
MTDTRPTPSYCQFGDDHTRPGVPLLPSERKNADGSAARAGDETLRAALASAAKAHLPDWPDVVTPHVLRHSCASQLYLGGMDLLAIQAALGHAWVATTMNYVHETSGIASAGRETAGHLVSAGAESVQAPSYVCLLTWPDLLTVPVDA